MKKVAFICSANMCRSPMAEAILVDEVGKRGLAMKVLSAGTMGMAGMMPVGEVQAVCAENGVAMREGKLSQGVFTVLEELKRCDRVLVMEEAHREWLVKQQLGLDEEKIRLLGEWRADGSTSEEIDDPIGQQIGAFRECFVIIRGCIQNFLEKGIDVEAGFGGGGFGD